MDITNFTWIDTFVIPLPSLPPVPPVPPVYPNTVIILASVFGVLGGVIILVCGFFVYRRIKKRRQENDYIEKMLCIDTYVM